jgi:hypothetical protein
MSVLACSRSAARAGRRWGWCFGGLQGLGLTAGITATRIARSRTRRSVARYRAPAGGALWLGGLAVCSSRVRRQPASKAATSAILRIRRGFSRRALIVAPLTVALGVARGAVSRQAGPRLLDSYGWVLARQSWLWWE